MNQGPAFREVIRSIRALLKGAVTAKFMKLAFTKEGEIMTARLADEHLASASEYFLGVKSKEDPRAVAKLVERDALAYDDLVREHIRDIGSAPGGYPGTPSTELLSKHSGSMNVSLMRR